MFEGSGDGWARNRPATALTERVMRIAEMNWMQVEQHAARDRRAVLPIGSTEQHAQLSLCVDAILAERVSVEAAAAARGTGVSGDQLRADSQLRRLRRYRDLAALDAVRAGLRRARRHGPRGLQADRHRQWSRRQRAGPWRGARVARPPSRRAGEVAQLVQRAADLGQSEGDRSGRAPMPRGWRTFPGPDCPA